MRQKVYAVEIQSRGHVLQRIFNAVSEIKKDLEEARRTTRRVGSTRIIGFRALTCLQANGGHF